VKSIGQKYRSCCELDKSEALNLICHASPLLAAYILSLRSCNLVLKISIQPSHEPLILLRYHKPASCNRSNRALGNFDRPPNPRTQPKDPKETLGSVPWDGSLAGTRGPWVPIARSRVIPVS
jgi:hypothetical protein